jgi:hypothetical protein
MGIFDRASQEDLENFKLYVKNRLDELDREIKSKVSDSEEVARAAANNAIEIEGNIKKTESIITNHLNELDSYKNSAKAELENIQIEKDSLLNINNDLKSSIEETKNLYNRLIESKKNIDVMETDVSKKIEKINEILEKSQMLPDSVERTNELLKKAKEINDNIQGLLAHSSKKKSEIDELYKSIYGVDIKNSDGNEDHVEHVDGLKDDLEKSYNDIHNQIILLKEVIEKSVKSESEKYDKQLNFQKEIFENLVSDSNSRISALNDQLSGLLPGAMAEGLSAAYEKKKEDEIKSSKEFQSSFNNSILTMILISLIPFSVDVYLLGWKGQDIVHVIKDTPSLIIAILPLYLPVLWVAFSSNKKINLSKRLIEEYTHKSVLGKTFSGLSNQIETLPHQSSVREELRTRLLFNILQVSAENPGKLITNYNKSDHPLMEALENSEKLSDAVEKLAKLPGFSAIAKKLSDTSEEFLKNKNDKIERGLMAQEALEETEEKIEK